MSFEFAITVFAAIFAIVNPIGNIPVFVAITQDYTPEQKSRVIRKVCIVAASVLFAFGIFGNYIFVLYGITIPAFKIAGGLLLFSIAFNMTRGQVGRGGSPARSTRRRLRRKRWAWSHWAYRFSPVRAQ